MQPDDDSPGSRPPLPVVELGWGHHLEQLFETTRASDAGCHRREPVGQRENPSERSFRSVVPMTDLVSNDEETPSVVQLGPRSRVELDEEDSVPSNGRPRDTPDVASRVDLHASVRASPQLTSERVPHRSFQGSGGGRPKNESVELERRRPVGRSPAHARSRKRHDGSPQRERAQNAECAHGSDRCGPGRPGAKHPQHGRSSGARDASDRDRQRRRNRPAERAQNPCVCATRPRCQARRPQEQRQRHEQRGDGERYRGSRPERRGRNGGHEAGSAKPTEREVRRAERPRAAQIHHFANSRSSTGWISASRRTSASSSAAAPDLSVPK